jgi:mitochondrial import receptor subunit TOM22
MVQLEEVEDDELNAQQPGPKAEDDDEWDTDTGPSPPTTTIRTPSLTATDSEVSDVDDDDALDESLFDRIAALKDIVPPAYRKNIASATSTGYSWASRALSLGGKTLWVVSTSALLLGVPWALAFGEEQQVQEMEREMQMQRNANEVSIKHFIAH